MNSRIALTILLISLGGCSWFKDDCPDGSCETQLLDNKGDVKKWYCYGKADETWDCTNEADPARIKTIRPEAKAPFVMPSAKVQSNEPAPDTTEITPPAPAAVEEEPDTHEAKLLAQPATHYTVQLVALPDEQSVVAYAHSNGLSDPLYVKIRNEGHRWYVLLLGVYPDKNAADAARSQWEKARTLKVKPWVRRLGPLQDAVRLAAAES